MLAEVLSLDGTLSFSQLRSLELAEGRFLGFVPVRHNNEKPKNRCKTRSRTFSYVLILDISLCWRNKFIAARFIDSSQRESCYVNSGVAFLGSRFRKKDENQRIDVKLVPERFPMF